MAENHLRDRLIDLIVAEEQQCQAAITADPLNGWLAGRLLGLQRARVIITEAPAEETCGRTEHIVVSTKDSARATRIRESIAAESMRDRCASAIEDYFPGFDAEVIRNLPLLPDPEMPQVAEETCGRCGGTAVDPEDSFSGAHYDWGEEPPALEPCRDCGQTPSALRTRVANAVAWVGPNSRAVTDDVMNAIGEDL